jgi:hypothetical protein
MWEAVPPGDSSARHGRQRESIAGGGRDTEFVIRDPGFVTAAVIEEPVRRICERECIPRVWLVASGANSEPDPGPVFDEASSGTAKGDAEYRRWRPGRRIAKNGSPVRVARKQKGLIRRMMNAEPGNSARPTAYRSLAREHSGLLGTYVCMHQGARNTSTSRHQQGGGRYSPPTPLDGTAE